MQGAATTHINKQVKLHSFGRRTTPLVVDTETILFKDKQLKISEVDGVLYWVSPIIFYHYMIGRRYHFAFKAGTEQLDIVFRSYFGISNKYFKKQINKVMDAVWGPITDRLLQQHMAQLKAGQAADFGYCQLTAEGIQIPKLQQQIPWHELVYEKKFNRLVLNNKSNHSIYTNIAFRDNWNVDVLITLLDWLTEQGGLQEIQHTGAKPDAATL